MAQTAVCNRHHNIDQQLCRWLLLSLDRLNGNQLVMTQELIANMLGVRREGVTEAAGRLHKLKVIEYTPGPYYGIGPAKTGTVKLRMLCRSESRDEIDYCLTRLPFQKNKKATSYTIANANTLTSNPGKNRLLSRKLAVVYFA
ncbi:Crp/Fnr family transcriptional regulator [Alishewanella longhuensis]